MGRDQFNFAAPPARPLAVSEATLLPEYARTDPDDDGLSADYLRAVAIDVCGDPADASKLVHAIVPKSSLNRRGRLTVHQSEQAERLARLFAMAVQAFQDRDDARTFMRRAHPRLGGARPIDAALSERGGRAVETILDSLLYGLPA